MLLIQHLLGYEEPGVIILYLTGVISRASAIKCLFHLHARSDIGPPLKPGLNGMELRRLARPPQLEGGGPAGGEGVRPNDASFHSLKAVLAIVGVAL